ncbi:MAG: Gfo/Idh/MocA family oxidoreductase [Planctomycetaceae bacterium]|nr:Gfo/Idh/MocA family oxidoreductase [Planctomycetaceae bacterium]
MPRVNRRQALATTGFGLGALLVPWSASTAEETAVKSPNARWRIGAIGMRYQGTVITREATAFGDVTAICDVDGHVRDQARASFGSTATLVEDYRDLIARKDVDVVMIGAPDHWHVKMAADACRAGKDVYVEKPVSLTIDEGKFLERVVAETGRVVQVGTWQRSDHRFRLAAEMVRAGRLGKIHKVTVALGKNRTGGPFEPLPVPRHFNWDRWLGQAPLVPYTPERSHYTFRFWYDYAGGEMTDTGAHHVDIAQWAVGKQHTGPVEVIAESKLPHVENGYNVPIDFRVTFKYADGLEIEVLDTGRNGVLFEGDGGRMFVNRGAITGTPVDELAAKPFGRGDFELYGADNFARPELAGKIDAIKNHMGNFYDCTQSRKTPISDVASQHRTATTCHLGNIAFRVQRNLRWDPERQVIIGDDEANALLARAQRSGYEIT